MNSRNANSPGTSLRRGCVILWVLAILVLLLVVGHRVWTIHQRNSLMAAIQRYRQAGEPVLPEDFAPPATEDPDNPVPEWRAAVAALKPLDSKLQQRSDWKELSVPLTAAEDQFLKEVLNGQDEALDHAEKASGMRGRPNWGIRFVSPTINLMLPDLNHQRQLANMLKRSALDAHFHGDDAQAIDRLGQIVAESRALQGHPTLVGHLVAIGVEALACDTARTIAPELRIGPASDGTARPAQSKQVRQLIAELLDDRPLREGQTLAFRTERMMEVDTAMQISAGKIPAIMPPGGISNARNSGAQGAIGTLLAAQFYSDGRFMLEYTSAVLEVARASDLPTFRARMNALPDLNRKRGAAHLLLSILLPAFNRAVEQDFRILTDSRLTALMLACRLYALDHGGEFPTRLEDLVPDYLPSIPADPFSTGSPLRYRPGPDPVVYSLGDNGADDGGSEQPISTRRGMEDRWQELDVVTHLTLQPRTAPPEPTSDDNANPVPTEPTSKPAAQ